MQTLNAFKQSSEITELLNEVTTIAIVGLSPKEKRPSNMVGRYLLDAGYVVLPVNPGQDEILGNTCYHSLSAIPQTVEVVNIFRKSEDVLPVVEQILELKPLPKAVWMQQGIVNEAAAELARKNGIMVVMDRCIKVDHENLLGK